MKEHPKFSTIITDGFNIFAKEWKLLVGITLMFMIPIYAILFWSQESTAMIILYSLLFLFITPIIQITLAKITEQRHRHKKTHPWGELWSYVKTKYWDVFLTIVVLALIMVIAFIALFIIFAIIAAIMAASKGIPTTPEQAIQGGWAILVGIAIVVGIVVMIILSTYLIFTSYIAALTKTRYLAAVKESIHLVKTRWWATFWRLLGIQVASLILVGIIMAIFTPMELASGMTPATNLIKSVVQQIIVLPMSVAAVAWYLRIK